MEVRTINGYKPINEIQIGDMVWSKNEKTGLMGYQKVLHTMNSVDPDTTYVTITDSYGHSQQIVSDSLHPYFSSYGNDGNPAKPSIGKEYHGDIKNAYWINAGDLKKGYKVLGSNGEWQVISEVYTVKTPLNSYNLEVNTDHTFFVKGIGGLDGVWVHNKDCWAIIPQEATTQIKNGQKIHTFEDRGRTVNVIENPEWSATGGKAKYIEVDANGKILNENEPNIHRATNRQAQNDSSQFVADPLHPAGSSSIDPARYKWIDEKRHPDINVTSKFEGQATSINGDYFTKKAEWQAPGKGTGLKYQVYQQEIDLNAKPFAQDGSMLTNTDLMKDGGAPYVLKNEQYEQVQLHHSQQDGRGALFEVTESTHLSTTKNNGGLALHPYRNNQHPNFPVNRTLFDKDRPQYWKDRLQQLTISEVK